MIRASPFQGRPPKPLSVAGLRIASTVISRPRPIIRTLRSVGKYPGPMRNELPRSSSRPFNRKPAPMAITTTPLTTSRGFSIIAAMASCLPVPLIFDPVLVCRFKFCRFKLCQ